MTTIIIIFTGLILTLIWLVRNITWRPPAKQPETVACLEAAPLLQPGQSLKILCWNVQFLAGKNYVFWYEHPHSGHGHERPTPADIRATMKAAARIIAAENPDIILLQEVDDGARRTDYEDQLAALCKLISKDYRCFSTAFYWKADFVPHPRIMGAVGLKLATLSKYRIDTAIRHQLAPLPENIIRRQFNLKRAVLETRLLQTNGAIFTVFNTHLEAFGQKTDVMQKQVAQLTTLLKQTSFGGWIMGGDFNLLPPGKAWLRLPPEDRKLFRRETELAPLYEVYQAVPALEEVSGEDYEKWYTHTPNGQKIIKPDRTIDYIFAADNVTVGTHYVRQHDTLNISDHLPMIVEITVP
jgi:endonuclease/exonuclease/phosphatase family metal-dependent hydrolase